MLLRLLKLQLNILLSVGGYRDVFQTGFLSAIRYRTRYS